MTRNLHFASPVGGHDPLAAGFALPLRATYYPMGVELEIATNSPDLIAAADEIWGRFKRSSPEKGLTFQLAVSGTGAAGIRPSPPRCRGHLVSIVHSPENFAVADLSRGFAFGWLTADVAADRVYARYHFLEPLVYVMLEALHFAPVHASCVALDGRAVLLCGASGAGKTSLAYACARRGWTYLSDDATHVVRRRPDCTVTGRPHHIRFRESARRLFPELCAYPPVRRPSGKLDIEVETESLGLTIAYERPAANVVFLNRGTYDCAVRVHPFPREEARRILEQVICLGDERTRAEQRSALGRLLELPTVELAYSDPGAAETALRRLVSCGGI
jgi:hypothetical protein